MKCVDITFPRVSDLYGIGKLKIFKKIGIGAYMTDLAYSSCKRSSEFAYWTSTSYGSYSVYVQPTCGDAKKREAITENIHMIRPLLKFSKEIFNEILKYTLKQIMEKWFY